MARSEEEKIFNKKFKFQDVNVSEFKCLNPFANPPWHVGAGIIKYNHEFFKLKL